MSIISTTYITWSEQAFFLKDNWIVNLLVLPIFTAFIIGLSRLKFLKHFSHRLENDKKLYLTIRYLLILMVFAVTMVWVWTTQITPFADAGMLHRISEEFLKGDYSNFKGGELTYMDLYPFQVRTVIWYVLTDRIFGGYRLMVYQTLNCIFIAAAFLALSDISLFMGLSRAASLAVIPCGIIWIPVVFYSSFIYGNIPALGFALIALDLWIKYFNLGKRTHLVFSVIAMGMAYCMKSIFLINLIAMVIYAIFKSLKDKDVRKICVSVPFMALILVLATIVPHFYFSEKTGEPLDQGLPTLSWLELGLSETVAAPGWYVTDPVYDYITTGYDSESHKEIVRDRISARIGYFKDEPRQFTDFEIRKIASQWNEPSAQSLWFMRESQIELSSSVNKLMSYPGYVNAVSIMDIMHLLLILGCVLYAVFFMRESSSLEKLLLPMIFVGGFLFHLAWEAKAQYAFLYWVMMLPVAVSGYIYAAKYIDARIDKGSVEKIDLRILKVILIVMTLTVIAVLTVSGLNSGLIKDNALFADYLLENFGQ